MKKRVLWSVGIIAGLALAVTMAVPTAHAVTATVSLSDVSLSKTGVGATGVTVTATMVVNTTIQNESDLTFRFQGNASMEQSFNFSNADITITGATGNIGDNNPDCLSYRLSSQLGTGTKTVEITGVKNALQAGLYTLSVEVRVPGSEGPGEQITASAPVTVGTIAVMGRVKMPDGTPVSQEDMIGVSVRDENFTTNISSGPGVGGWYAIPVQSSDEWNPGTITAGNTYYLEVWPGNAPGVVAPDPVSFVYGGSMVTKNLTLVAATKTLNVTVKYGDGDPVTSVNIWANKRSGGGGVGGDVDSSGVLSISVSGGTWEVMVNCGWDQELQQPNDCDWTYNQPPQMVEFANNSTVETKSVAITVEKTNAKIKGTVKLPNGDPLPGGFVDIRAGEMGGAGTGINGQDGTFTANIKAGDYKLSVHPDEWQNPEMAKYYMDEISVRVAENETKTLTIVMKEKTSKIIGKVVDKSGAGVANIWLNSWKRTGQGWANTQSGADGTFAMWVSSGEWEVNVDTHRPPAEGETSNFIPADNRPVNVIISDNQTVSGVTLTVQLADATVVIKMVNSNGSAVTDFWGYAFCRKKDAGWGPGNEFGSGVDRGTATIPLLGGFTYVCGTHLPPDIDMSLDQEVEVAVAVGGTKEVKLVLAPNDSAIVGWIKDQNGKVVVGMEGEVFAVEAGNWQWRPGKLNPDGSYRISLRGGADKRFMVGVHFWNRESGYMETHPEPDSAFSVPANSEITKIITAFKADTSISGTVYAPDGTPMPHVWVDAGNWKQMEGKIKGDFEGGKEIHAGTETMGDGTYRIDIISGEYTLHSGMPPEYEGDYMQPQEIDVTVTAAAPATGVDLHYRQADAFITATVKFEDGTTPNFGWCHAWSEKGGHSGKDAMGGSSRIPLTAGTWWVGCDTHSPSDNKFYRSQEQQITLVVGDSKSASFTLVEESFTIPDSFTQTFTATQQNNFTMPDGTSVAIPANAAGTDESTYTFIGTPTTNMMFTDSDKPLRYGWNYEITKLDSNGNQSLVETFNSNVTICMPIPDNYLAEQSLTVADVFAKYWDVNSGMWKLPESAVITDDGFACLQVSHFTEFALTTGARFGASAGGPAYVVATPASAGGPQVTAWDANGNMKLNFFAYASSLRIGIQAVAGDIDGDGTNEIIVAPGAGAGPQIRVFNLNGEVIGQFLAFGAHLRTGYNLAVADVTGDGVDEIIVTTMAGAGPQVRVFDGSGNVVSQFFAYGTEFRGGVTLTTGDIDGDGVDEIITVPKANSAPHVRVFDYDGTEVAQFFAYASTVRGSYHVSTGDVDADGTADIIVTPGPGLGPQVAMFTGNGELIRRFFAYATTFRGGMHASVGDVDGDGENEVIATPESDAGPHVRVFNTAGAVESSFFAYATHLRGSFSSVIADVNSDGISDIVTAPGAGMGPHVRAFNVAGEAVAQFFTHHTGFRGGLNISTVPVF